MGKSIFIIAEAGVNHNGNNDLAFKLVDAAVNAGADAIKFQTFKAESLVTKNATKAKYQRQTTDIDESQFEMLKKLELSHEIYRELIGYCKEKGIQFLSTAFDLESLDFLVNELGLRTLKISSGEITNGPLLLAHAETGCDLIVSTGMATLDEVEDALGVLAFGFTGGKSPSRKNFRAAYNSKAGLQAIKEKVTLLHCTTEYPAPFHEINLNAMHAMREVFGLDIGYSDHSEGITVPISAATLGAVLLEKHFTLDKNLPGPDHKASLDPDELKDMISAIRIVEKILGDPIKKPTFSEIGNREIARRSLVAAKNIDEGASFTEKNLTMKRPGTGISPMRYWDFLGTRSTQSYNEDEVIC